MTKNPVASECNQCLSGGGETLPDLLSLKLFVCPLAQFSAECAFDYEPSSPMAGVFWPFTSMFTNWEDANLSKRDDANKNQPNMN